MLALCIFVSTFLSVHEITLRHLGDRHLPTEIQDQVLRMRPDHVIEDMLHRFGADLVNVRAPFQPEGGAYGGQGHHHNYDEHEHHHE